MYRKLQEDPDESESGIPTKSVEEIIHKEQFAYNMMNTPYKRTYDNGQVIGCNYTFGENYKMIKHGIIQKFWCMLGRHIGFTYSHLTGTDDIGCAICGKQYIDF